ncbi:KAP family P-loop NTPase fold protein [Celeribacter halophilus]|uniref:KAP family P-loop NTPase fold protein n=1 Tax=Celeribacter halophilus TaxID=576117 RepID=UPI003A8F60A5
MTAQRLTLPDPEIELYEDGFDAKDRGIADLGRKEDGKKLSDLVEKFAEPMVIAVDAPWGAGKSVFLKCWVGEHIKPKYKRKTTTVYFDAFQHDFLDDPLVSIFKEVTDRIEKLKPETTEDAEQQRIAKLKDLSGKAKKYVPILGRAALRLAVGTVATEAIMDIENPDESSLDELLQNANSEAAKAIGAFWNAEETHSQAMNGFREYLSDLAKAQKLVIVVDELDRCRPDYALNLLEVIKHFFNVENVHFVLGVNLTELENSVRARYGAGVNAGLYLQKFVTVKMPLSVRDQHLNKDANADHFHNISQSMGIDTKQKTWQYLDLIIKDCPPRSMTLRSIERLTTTLKLSFLGHSFSWKTSGHDLLRAALLVIKVCETDAYQNILHGKIKLSEFRAVFGLFGPPMAQNTGENHITQASEYIFTDPDDRDKTSLGGSLFKPDMFRSYGDDEMKYLNGPQILQKLATEELEVFQLPT